MLEEWNTLKNEKQPDQFAYQSNKKVWWICKEGHEWQAVISTRTVRRYGCPFCSSHSVLKGYNDIFTLKPDLKDQWHPSKNDIDPFTTSANSSKKVWWICKEGHEWQAAIRDRNQGDGCPYCSGHRVMKGFNDLETKKPDLSNQWHPTKNGLLKPSDVTIGSHKKVWWIDELGHEWNAEIKSRALGGNGCPYCAGRKVLQGFNDLFSQNPSLASEWNQIKNGSLTPEEVTSNSNKIVWWKCNLCGYEWKAAINYRNEGPGCPYCARYTMISFEEKAISYYLSYIFEIEENYHSKELGKFEIDCYIPSLKMGIEYDGEKWHRDVARDIRKNELCKRIGIELIRIRESGCPPMNQGVVIPITRKDRGSLDNAIKELLAIISDKTNKQLSIDVDTIRDGVNISEKKYVSKREKSLLSLEPKLATEWHPTKNGFLLPSNIPLHYNGKVWWLGKCGHEWQATVNSRSAGNGCPICNAKQIKIGFNDLATTHPEIAKQWHPTKNGSLTPLDVSYGTDKKVYWICEKGHEWSALIYSRVKSGCPVCNRKKLLIGFNDLETEYPEIAEEWHSGNSILPSQVISKTEKKYWWLGKCGHEWQASPGERIRGRGCPYCVSKRVLKGFNDFGTSYPECSKYWDYEHNEKSPFEISPKSNKKYWWKCELGHSWQSTAAS
ncbi:MAG: zinc-ribbon domain-containing protein [Candidatus Methanomethylophilaceae archaeon]|nr:zinc-ribbon domain-containing protein [Candidatus Methanomethylophilaceae archaeon]